MALVADRQDAEGLYGLHMAVTLQSPSLPRVEPSSGLCAQGRQSWGHAWWGHRWTSADGSDCKVFWELLASVMTLVTPAEEITFPSALCDMILE